MKGAGFILCISFTLFSCEERFPQTDNVKRNELAGIWRIERVVNEGFTVDTAGIKLTRFDTTYSGINAYYTISIPSVGDQASDPKLAYGNIEGQWFDCEVQAFGTKNTLDAVTLDRNSCPECQLSSTYFNRNMQGSWEVREYQIRKRLVLTKWFSVNGAKRESSIEFSYAL